MMQQSPLSALDRALAAADLAYTDPAQATRLATSALGDAPRDAEVTAAAERALGMAGAATGNFDEAVTRLRRAASVADAAHLRVRAGQARASLAYVLLLTSGAPAALRELDRAEVDLQEGVAAARLQMQRGLVLSEIRRFDEAAASLERALVTLRRCGGDDLLEADIRNNRAIVALGTGDWDTALADLRRAETVYQNGAHRGRTAMVWHNRAVVEGRRGNVPAALAAFDTAAERYRDAGLHPGLLDVDRAETLLAVGLVADARQATGDAVAEFVRQCNDVDLVQARLLLAEAALAGGDPESALVEADRARRSARQQQRARWAALAGQLRVRARWRTGDRSLAAIRAGSRIAAELEAAGWWAQSLDVHLVVARTALELGRPRLARPHLVRAASARRGGLVADRVRAWHAEALLRQARGDPAGAARAVRAGLAVLDRFQTGLGATELRSHAAVHTEDLARLGVRLAVDSGRPAAVFAAAERRRAGALRSRPARPPDDRALVADLAALRQVTGDLRDADPSRTRALEVRQRALEHAVRTRARHAAGTSERAERSPGLRRVQQTLGRSVLVEYVDHEGVLLAVTVTAQRVRCVAVGPVAAVTTAIEALRTGLRWAAAGVGSARAVAAVRESVTRHARTLDTLLLAPLSLGDVDRPLVIVPTGVLHATPWSVLPSCATRAVSVAPSAALWWRAATQHARAGGRTVLAHGPELPHAAAEVVELARLLPGAQSLLGADAQVAPVLAALDGAATAHLAAHGSFRSDNPMFSSLQLADGPLTVYDLEGLGVPPEHVVLACCDSGRATVTSGDEVIGLAAALLAMGTRTLVASVVPVPDEASRTLMLRFHRHRAAGTGAAEALRRARTDVSPPSGPNSVLDVAAAGFVCFGAG